MDTELKEEQCTMGDFDNHHWTPITNSRAPRNRCDEALPLGNALMGMLVWMRQDTLLLSLDRGDLWDERRPAAEQKEFFNWQELCSMIEQGSWKQLKGTFEKSEAEPWPTRMPGGRIELPWRTNGTTFDIDLERALAKISNDDGSQIELMVPATETAVSRWKITGCNPAFSLHMPAFEEKIDPGIDRLGYIGPVRRKIACGQLIAIQNADASFSYAIGMGSHSAGDGIIEGAVVISVDTGIEAALDKAEKDLTAALQREFIAVQKEHEAWWQQFYSHNQVRFADTELMEAYQRCRYFFGCNARKDRPPMALQGIWTMDNGTLPPWRGDYHNNLNTQFSYLAYLAANDLDGGREFLDFLFRLLPRHKQLAREFYGAKRGAVIPGAMTRAGNFMPASVNYSYHPDNGMWIAWMFYRHWRYTQDAEFLALEAYPYAKAVAEGAMELAELDAAGKYRFPWHASPELGDNQPEAYFKEMTSYVNCNFFALLKALAEMAGELHLTQEEAVWQEALPHCIPPETMTARYRYYLYDKTVLGIQCGRPLPNSHRHLVHLMGFYPFDLFDFEHKPALRTLLADTMNQLDLFGPGQWVGFSWPWAAMMELRLGNPAKTLRFIKAFLDGFCTVNGFNVNGDFKDMGYSAYKYRPFTLETNFAAQEAMQELLLHESCGLLKFFPAAAVLGDAEFTNLRAPGAFLISGHLTQGRIKTISILSEAGKRCCFANFAGDRWIITAADGQRVLDSTEHEIAFDTTPGASYHLHCK